MKKVPFASILLLLLLGCNRSPATDTQSSTRSPYSYAAIRGPLLAKVNDWAIGLDDFKTYLNKIKPFVGTSVDVESEKFKREFLNDLVRTQVLAQIAKQKGYDTDDDVQRALRDTKNSLLASKLRAEIEKTVNVTSDDVSNFYDRNKQFFKKPQKIKIREIAVSSENQAKELYVRILQNEDFASLARQYSVLPSREKGGDLGTLYPDKDKATKFAKFWEVAGTLSKGEVSNIFKGSDGNSYIIKVEELEGGQIPSLSEIERDLKDALRQDKLEVEINKLIDGYRKKERVEINEDLIK